MAVIGPGRGDPEAERLAFEAGAALAALGAIVVCGGLGGAMEAACRGAKEGGGTTLGILPGRSRAEANGFVDVIVATGMGEARNAVIVRTADALLAVHGEWGTLSEIALAMQAGKPVVGLGTWELAKAGRPVEAFERAADPPSAAARAVELAGTA